MSADDDPSRVWITAS
ncbi:Protein of unknown function [Propionibacterium freudenreichii]|uniref:Uncharacterized protein n=1 Tax=Propionibacterium freudenreichii subsp. shermanii (strain ATCC 9614 / DSM 4902 / CIP 103027 / NCIMB 8099 / CIRM-BIA1) TaxID=754252 RepID=D7GF82_PROFC|nr:Hypothetical protein PFREUD_16820 [Propionibacterium freudenreichii subsp. shermanii CIRM-BIA1]CDP48925.1 Protein of unknown function [Propionibacterium freudenreichii subsp. freudenreichii]CEG86128.1 Protein of unknown function [Propionibacterium freudenreichii]CEG98393.1 Protein of unknown function [Propionibacterium freudenreichii]CEI25938.1 Protein of unknown function [Propionibacterium freudenreichii]